MWRLEVLIFVFFVVVIGGFFYFRYRLQEITNRERKVALIEEDQRLDSELANLGTPEKHRSPRTNG